MNRKWIFLTGIVSILMLLASGVCMADEEKEHEEHFGPHRIELFLGNTYDEEENDFTVGVGYEYRINHLLGVGAFLETVDGVVREWIFVIPLYLHPYKGWRFAVAAGVEGEKPPFGEEFLFRLGVGYEFEINRFSITPEFNLDFVHGRRVPVFGVTFGYGF